MKIKCSKDDLLRGLNSVYRAVSAKNTIYGLGGILLQAEAGEMIYKATDLEIAIEYRDKNIEIEEEGSIIVPGRYFMEIAKRLPDEEILFSTDGYSLYIRYSGSEITVNGYDQEEFPAFPQVTGEVRGSFNLADFQKDIKEVSIAGAYDESRPILTSVLFEIEGPEINMVATDTHRLAVKKTVWQNTGEKENAKALIPARVLREIAKSSLDEDERMEVVIGESQISFSLGNTLFISRLVEGKFPNYQPVIPAEEGFIAKAEISVSHFISTLDRAAVMVKDQAREKAGRVKLTLENENLTVRSHNTDVGKMSEAIPVFQEGQDLELVVNSRYFLEFLAVVDSDTIIIKFTGPSTPIVMIPKDEENYLYLALPLRTQ
ncbi:MAG: DNA polymerase III subunit beta [Bacillota bacterium]|nr:DNA polymerase III subunit beta [Bacillota bacterium]